MPRASVGAQEVPPLPGTDKSPASRAGLPASTAKVRISVPPLLPAFFPALAQIRFIHQRCGLQGMIRSFPLEVVVRQAAQLVVDQRHQAIEGFAFALRPAVEQQRNIRRGFRHRFPRATNVTIDSTTSYGSMMFNGI